MTATGISQKEYLKKYLSSGDGKKKKKKKAKANPVVNRLRIVDDDVDIHNLRPLEEDELELYELQEDAPQIAGIIDERPEEVKNKEKFGSTKWKVVADESDMGVKIIDKSKNNDLEKNPSSHIHEESAGGDLSPPRKSRKDAHIQHDSDESPPRKNTRSSDNSPVNKRNKKRDSDESPPRKNRSVDDSPENKKFKKYDFDESPPRKNRKSEDNSPMNKRSKKYDSDKSPPRKNRWSTDNSPMNKRSKKYDSDESPPRKNRRSIDNSPMNKRTKKYDSDGSPPRKNRWSIDNSPMNKRSKKYDSDESPPRKNRRSTDNSPMNKRSKKYNLDKSPPRKSRWSVNDSSVNKGNENQDSDESPPRRNHRKGQADVADDLSHRKPKIGERDATQHGRRRQNYDSDVSPIRKRRTSTPPKRRHGESPAQRKKKSDSEDNSVQAKGHKYDSDTSPPRRSKKNGSQNTQSPTGRRKYDSDESPPRKTKRKSSESSPRRDIAGELKGSHRKDPSPYSRSSTQRRESPLPGRSKERSVGHRSRKSDSDESPPRRRRPGEASPPRNRGKRRDWSPPKQERRRSPDVRYRKGREAEGSSRKYTRWTDGGDSSWSSQRDSTKRNVSPARHRERMGGSTSYKEVDRNDRKKEQKSSSSQRWSDSDVSPERRTKPTEREESKKQTLDGRKAGLVGAEELKAEIADLRHKEKEIFEKMDVNVSGRGAAPVMRDRKTGKKRDLEEEAREKQEKDIRQAEREAKYMEWGKGVKQVTDKAQKMEEDLYEMSKPLARYADDADLDKFLRDQEREGDPMLQYIKSKTKTKEENSKPQYEGSFMPNRFGIRPGYRWDGVDRSNGYEKQWFETQNAKKAVEEEAYKWSTSDM